MTDTVQAAVRAPADTNINRFWYGLGHGAEGIKTSALSSVVLFYFSQVLGLDAKLAGLALLLAVVTDGIADVLIGAWSDSTRGRWGRRHPFMYAAALPFALSFAAIFLAPQGMSQGAMFAWLLIGCLIARNAMAMFIVPYYALGVELSSDHDARTTIVAYRAVFNYLGMMLVFVVGAVIFTSSAAYPSGQLDPSRYPLYGVLLGAIMLFMTLGCTIGTHNTIPHLPKALESDRFHLGRLVADVGRALRTRSYAALFFGLFIWATGLIVLRIMEIYLATYFWRLDHSLVFLLPLCGYVASLFATPLWAWAAGRLGKRPAILLSLAGSLIAYALLISARAFDILTPQTPHYVVIVFAASFIAAMISSAAVVLGGAMLADVCDEFELNTGLRREGVLSGGTAFITKCSTGVAGQIAGLIIGGVALAPKADPTTVSDAVSNHLALAAVMTFALFTIASGACFSAYPLSRRRVHEIQAALRSRKQGQ
jgi:GPH family glycoside/pentoside/hexuronide:cation symporter